VGDQGRPPANLIVRASTGIGQHSELIRGHGVGIAILTWA
jgi:hypothetical protein